MSHVSRGPFENSRTFAQVLEAQQPPRNLGDVTLRYEPSLLIGEAKAQTKSRWPFVFLVFALAFSLMTLAFFVVRVSTEWMGAGAALSALMFLARFLMDEREKRRRAFVLNFRDNTLRLDFVTPFNGQPRTLIVDFDDVKAVNLEDNAIGCWLTIDFLREGRLLRDVLVTSIRPEDRGSAERFLQTLSAAFGLGEIPSESPYLSEASQPLEPIDSFGV
jgi:hypothetical protein